MRKLILTVILFVSSLLSATAFAGPSFSFSPVDGSGLKLHCVYRGNVVVNPDGEKANGFESSILFSGTELNVSHYSIDSYLISNSAGFINSYGLYQAYGLTPAGVGQYFTTSKLAATFLFNTLINITGTTLIYRTYTGATPTFGLSTTADGLVINGYDVAAKDILTSISGATYSFDMRPCIIDTDAPKLYNLSPSGINGTTKIPGDQAISGLIVDWHGSPITLVSGPLPLHQNARSHYWYNGGATTLSNYVDAPDTVDNQAGVDSGTITITIAIDGQVPQTLILGSSNLQVSDFAGDGDINQYTWDSKIRGYDIVFTSAIAYPVEKRVDITIAAEDNPNETGATHAFSSSFFFNAPVAPTIIRTSPLGSVNISPKIPTLSFLFTDDWAGIDTGSIYIEIPAIYSGVDLLMTGYIYSGDDLDITLSAGAPGLGNEGGYTVSLDLLWDLPETTYIAITGFALDLAGTTGTANLGFTTRKPCSFYGCLEPPLQIFNLGGIYSGTTIFTGTYLIVTGAYSNTSYFTGDGTLLYCANESPYVTLSGNIPLMTNAVDMRGREYTGNKLYITGLDFVLSGNTIIVLP